MEHLPCVEIDPPRPATHAVIWLHGLGADGNDFLPIVPHLRAPPTVRFVFPHAPSIPVTINGGYVMPAWYDIREADLDRRHDEAGIRASGERLRDLVRRENERGVPTERIVLAGFSQGGAIATYVALRHPDKLAGLLALSTYLVLGRDLEREASDANRQIPVFLAHGTQDPMVKLQRGAELRERLVALGYPVEWHTYPMQHQVCIEEIDDIREWLAARVAAS